MNHTLSSEEKTSISATLKSIRKEVDLVGVVTFAQLFQSYAEDAKFSECTLWFLRKIWNTTAVPGELHKKSSNKLEGETEEDKRAFEEALRNHPVLLVKVINYVEILLRVY